MVGLGLHPGHGQLPGAVHRLSQDLQFLVLRPFSGPQANVIDGRSDHEAKRLESGLAEQYVLRDRQVGGETPDGSAPAVWASLPSAACGSHAAASPGGLLAKIGM